MKMQFGNWMEIDGKEPRPPSTINFNVCRWHQLVIWLEPERARHQLLTFNPPPPPPRKVQCQIEAVYNPSAAQR